MKSQWQILYETLGLKKHIDHEINVFTGVSVDSVKRVSQAIARDDLKKDVDDASITKSFNLFVENADALANNQIIQQNIKDLRYFEEDLIKEERENKQFNAIRAELSVSLLDINQLYESVKTDFKDVFELQNYIDKVLLPQGYIYEPRRGYYKWI